MNNAAILQHSVATERQQFMIQGWSGSHPALTGLGTCSAGVHRSLQRLRDELSVGKVIILLTYPWLWMNGCVPVGMLKGLGVTLCCATCFLQYSVQEQRVWTELISPGSFLVLSFIAVPIWDVNMEIRAAVTVTELNFLEKFMERENHSIMQHHGYGRYEVTAPKV